MSPIEFDKEKLLIVEIGGIRVKLDGNGIKKLRPIYRGFLSNSSCYYARISFHEVKACSWPNSKKFGVSDFKGFLPNRLKFYNLPKKFRMQKNDLRKFIYDCRFRKRFLEFKRQRQNSYCININRSLLFINSKSRQADFFYLAGVRQDIEMLEKDLAVSFFYNKLFWNIKGLFLHSAGVKIGNRACLFLGHSGRGKTTLSMKSGNRPVLSDEVVGIRKLQGKFIASATPWGACKRVMRNKNLTVQVGGLFFLNKDKVTAFYELSPPVAIAKIIEHVFNFRLATDEEFKDIFQLSDNFLRIHKSWMMHSGKDDNIWRSLTKMGVEKWERV